MALMQTWIMFRLCRTALALPALLCAGLACGSGESLVGVASVIDGDTLVVGAHAHHELGRKAGAAYVFVRNGGGWAQQTILRLAPPMTVSDAELDRGLCMLEQVIKSG